MSSHWMNCYSHEHSVAYSELTVSQYSLKQVSSAKFHLSDWLFVESRSVYFFDDMILADFRCMLAPSPMRQPQVGYSLPKRKSGSGNGGP